MQRKGPPAKRCSEALVVPARLNTRASLHLRCVSRRWRRSGPWWTADEFAAVHADDQSTVVAGNLLVIPAVHAIGRRLVHLLVNVESVAEQRDIRHQIPAGRADPDTGEAQFDGRQVDVEVGRQVRVGNETRRFIG